MRRSLALLILAGIIPIVALGGTFGAVTLRNEREAIIARGRTAANLASTLLSLTVRSNVEAVKMVAQSPTLDGAEPDIARFTTLARRILANQRDWRAVALAQADGRLLFSTLPPAERPSVLGGLDAAALRRLRATGQPQVGAITTAPSGERFMTVLAPVGPAGKVRLVVSALIPVTRIEGLLRVEPLASGWTASIVTRAGVAVIVPADGRNAVSIDPRPVEMWMPVAGTKWSVRITAPAQAFLAPVRHAALLLLSAATLCILLLMLLARMLALELRQERNREASELQRQRMEALGRLTGGVAHDFNNLLTPIMISLDLIGHRNVDVGLVRHLDAAIAGVERARMLVSRLLSFSRQQQLSPEAVELRALIDGLMDLIEKSLTPAIKVAVEVEPGLCAAEADRGQLELAILNLVINARDAMPSGGRLEITARPVADSDKPRAGPGDFVAITISDTGMGMDGSTIANAVEPFFTTKPVGKGTGLGLSMVDGFASQSGGAFVLDSEYAKGTRASIILPCSSARPPTPPAARTDVGAEQLRILLVDDDDRVRRASAEVLTEAGHTVVEAADVDLALAVLVDAVDIDLVVTDFIMPGRSGAELVEALRVAWPRVAVLMVTGHVDDDSGLPSDLDLLRKPFRSAALLKAVDDAIRRSRARLPVPFS